MYIPLFAGVDCCHTRTLSPDTTETPSIVCVELKVMLPVVATLQGTFVVLPLICEYVPILVIGICYKYSKSIYIFLYSEISTEKSCSIS